jgi:hypothetical protein
METIFTGFAPDAFKVLQRIRQEPRMERFRIERSHLREHVQKPFEAFRDEIAVRHVIPRQLPLETERNVFSRILKNDFGAGGVHDHLWLSFYRIGLTRLTDVQIIHSIDPDGFWVGLHVQKPAGELYREIRWKLIEGWHRSGPLVNAVIAHGYPLSFASGSGSTAKTSTFSAPLAAPPAGLERADRIWLGRELPASEVVRLGEKLPEWALARVDELAPLYEHFTGLRL